MANRNVFMNVGGAVPYRYHLSKERMPRENVSLNVADVLRETFPSHKENHFALARLYFHYTRFTLPLSVH